MMHEKQPSPIKEAAKNLLARIGYALTHIHWGLAQRLRNGPTYKRHTYGSYDDMDVPPTPPRGKAVIGGLLTIVPDWAMSKVRRRR